MNNVSRWQRLPEWARGILWTFGALTVLGLLALGFLRCYGDPGIGVTVDNQAGTNIYYCAGRSPTDTSLPTRCGQYHALTIASGESTSITELCLGGDAKWVALSTESAKIYERTATCSEWSDANDATLVVQEIDGQFTVFDSFED